MKVMITGLTPGHTQKIEQLGICNLSQMSREILVELGHEVEQKLVTPEDDVLDYDLLIYGVSSITSMYVNRRIWSLWFLWKALNEGVPVLISINDWHIHDTFAGFRWHFNNPHRWAEKAKRLSWAHPEFLIEHQDQFHEVIGMLHQEQWPLTMATFFPWGDREIFCRKGSLTPDRLREVDVTARQPYHDQPWVPPSDRIRKWILASMGDHGDWAKKQGSEWGWHSYGHRRSQQPRLDEATVVKLYSKYWGVFNFGYSVSGSGWWRNRYAYAARSLAVLHGGQSELQFLGEPYSHPLEYIEGLSDRRLINLARDQRDHFFSLVWDDDYLVHTFDNIIREATGRFTRTGPAPPMTATLKDADRPVKPTRGIIRVIEEHIIDDAFETDRREAHRQKKAEQKAAREQKKKEAAK